MGFSKKKNIISKYKKLQRMHVCFRFHHGGYVGGTFTRRVFKFCLRNHTTEKRSHFTLLQFTACRKRKRKKLRHTCIQFQEPCTNVLRQRYLQVPPDLFTFIKEIFKRNITFHAASVLAKLLLRLELGLKKKSQFQNIIILRDFDFGFDTYLCSFLTHFQARWHQNVSCRFD